MEAKSYDIRFRGSRYDAATWIITLIRMDEGL
jgi:hypothetical protein